MIWQTRFIAWYKSHDRKYNSNNSVRAKRSIYLPTKSGKLKYRKGNVFLDSAKDCYDCRGNASNWPV